MLDPAIQVFLNERKEMWLKKKVTPRISDEEKHILEQEANDAFTLASWLPDAAKRAKQLSLVSHPSKFTHPSAKTSSVIAQAERRADGYLRTGNVDVELDVFGNAAAMDVYKFLTIELNNGQNILEHLENETTYIEEQFTLPNVTYEELAKELLAIKQKDEEHVKTSGLVKQVYFPINNEGEYHLLSVLTPSGIMYKLKERLNKMRFSDEAKLAREAKKKGQVYKHGYSDIFGLGAIGFGGTKPQNISVLNSKNGGIANLLPSMPPQISQKNFSPPAHSFFGKSLYLNDFKSQFQELHKQLSHDVNNRYVRWKIEGLIKDIIYQVIDKSWRIRRLDAGWSQKERCESLPRFQKLWLDQYYKEERTEDDKWLDKVKIEIARWFIGSYRKILADDAIQWDDSLLLQLKNIVTDCEEALK